jgi:hypothetical protein
MDYLEKLAWYRKYIENHQDETSRRGKEYVSYLEAWFDDTKVVDGANYSMKVRWQQLPMSYNQYFG